MHEFFKSLFNSSRERVKNPLIGSFVLSWLVFNWDSVLTLIYSKKSIEERIKGVRPTEGICELGFWIPLGMSLIYVFLIPYIMHFVDTLTLDSFNRRKKLAYEKRMTELELSQEVVKQEVELEKLRVEFKDVTQLNKENESLKKELTILEQEAKNSKEGFTDLANENSRLSSELKRAIEVSEKGKSSSDEEKPKSKKETLRAEKRLKLQLRKLYDDKMIALYRKLSTTTLDKDGVMNLILVTLDELRDGAKDLISRFGIIGGEFNELELFEYFNMVEDEVSNLSELLNKVKGNGTDIIKKAMDNRQKGKLDFLNDD